MSKVPSFVIKQLNDKITQRYVVNADDFFQIIESMGISDNLDALFEVIQYFEESKIDVFFKNGTDHVRYQTFRNIEQQLGIMRRLNKKHEEITELNRKANNIKPHMDDSWLKSFMIEDDEEKNKYLLELKITTTKSDDLTKLKERLTQDEVDRRNRNN
jgi:hypothetical protein